MTLYFTTINGVDQPAEVTHVVLHLQNRIKELEAKLKYSNAADARLFALLKEARKIIRASSSRNLVKDWDERATAAIKQGERK